MPFPVATMVDLPVPVPVGGWQVSTMLKWFPDRRGLAAGLSLTAFGGGAMVAAPVNEALFNHYRVRAGVVVRFSSV